MLSKNRKVTCEELQNNHMLPSDKVRKQQKNCNLEIKNNGHGKSSADLIISRWALELILGNNRMENVGITWWGASASQRLHALLVLPAAKGLSRT